MTSQRIVESIQELPIAEQRKIALAVLNGILSQSSDSTSPIAFTMAEFLRRINQAEVEVVWAQGLINGCKRLEIIQAIKKTSHSEGVSFTSFLSNKSLRN